MSHTNHGNNLTGLPVLQPGSSFDITESGFDTGTRKFVIDQSRLPLVLPVRGTADTVIAYTDQSGRTQRGGYAGMYVNAVSGITELANNLAEYTVSYLGLIKSPKPVFIREGTSINQLTDTYTVSGNSVVMPAFESLPTATRIYVTKTRPRQGALGAIGSPPELRQSLRGVGGIPATFGGKPIIFRDWVLTNREMRHAGPLYEVTDSHAVTVVRYEE